MSSNGGGMKADKGMKGEKTIKGCIRAENGNNMLEEKGGKMAKLDSSTDLTAHNGHMVKVHGMWEDASAMSSSAVLWCAERARSRACSRRAAGPPQAQRTTATDAGRMERITVNQR